MRHALHLGVVAVFGVGGLVVAACTAKDAPPKPRGQAASPSERVLAEAEARGERSSDPAASGESEARDEAASNAASAPNADSDPTQPAVLGAPPLCEVSAQARAADGWFWLADNEVRDALWEAPPVAGDDRRLHGLKAVEMPASKKRGPRDIEALAWLGEHLVVVGSHSRNKDCARKPKRQRIRLLERTADNGFAEFALAETDLEAALADAATCTATLLAADLPGGGALCAALVAADAGATEDACQTVNIEGAVVIDGALWLGLRAPLFDGDALLLRVDAAALRAGALKLDGWRRLDLSATGDARGIRELHLDAEDGALWAIAGPELDADRAHQLVSVPVPALASGSDGDRLTPTLGPMLPTSSEGLARLDGGWIALIDGAEGDGETTCDTPSRQVWVADAPSSH